MKQDGAAAKWRVPYLAVDPHDLGLSYESVIRLNSQSGKGGVSWTLQRVIDLDLPRGLQAAFSKRVKAESEARAATIPPNDVARLFLEQYHVGTEDPRVRFATYRRSIHDSGTVAIEAAIVIDGEDWPLHGHGADVLSAVANAIADTFRAAGAASPVFCRHQRHLALEDGRAQAVAIVECQTSGSDKSSWGVSVSDDLEAAGLKACLASVAVWHSA